MATDQLFITRTLVAFVATSFFAILCRSPQARGMNYTFVKDAARAPEVSYYDYIIVGGGTAGCPLAATLSEHFRVLLLERGGSPYDDERIGNMTRFSDTLSDTSAGSPAQRFVSEDGVINSRPRVLGGGSCINAGFYTRASDEYVRGVGWDLEATTAAYRWVEDVVAFQPEVGPWQAALQRGLLESGIAPDNGFTFDHVDGTKVGGSIFDADGRRHTAADLLRYARADRLDVLLRARVAKILFNVRGSRPVAHGVVFHDSEGQMHKAYLNAGQGNEILLSAGAMGSPQLLMLSGVGPADHLNKFGITLVHNQSAVGQGMYDNPMNAVYVPSPTPVEVSLIQVVGITEVGSYIEGASGSNWGIRQSGSGGGQRPHNFGMFSPQTGQLATVPPKQRTPEAIARAAEAMSQLNDTSFRGGFILEKILGPLSTGHLELRNRDPDDNPAVTFNYFSHPEDLRRCVAGLSVIERVIQSEAFENFTYPYFSVEALLNMTAEFPVNLLPRHDNDSKSLEQFCKDTVMTIWHYHGGCQVGKVVDTEYRVLGVDALRVIDGSTFNASPGTNPQATVMMLGRYMGFKIQNERLKAGATGGRKL
ncbi:protein HOTHEAD-like [Phragmites australis]|uniref:protein HOTHEAD-like n=1 Tax=Phragmites australis TaxID=29695 RepID=UPI002D766B22|nr:protein HOTHEAD-like [Phragmites australis]